MQSFFPFFISKKEQTTKKGTKLLYETKAVCYTVERNSEKEEIFYGTSASPSTTPKTQPKTQPCREARAEKASFS